MRQAALVLIFALALAAAAQEPRVINGKVETHAVAAPLAATLKQLAGTGEAPVWIGYAVPASQTHPRFICCFDQSNFAAAGCCSGCKLEGHNSSYFNSDGGSCVAPEPP